MLNTETSPLFDYAESVRLKEQGMMLSASSCPDWLERARAVARHLAAKQAEVCVEDVYRVVGTPPNPNAAGSIFKGKEWRCVGFRQAERSSRHCGLQRRWSLR